MNRAQSPWTIIVLILALAAAGIGLVWLNRIYVENYPAGEDFQRYWIAIHEFVSQGKSPYQTILESSPGVQTGISRQVSPPVEGGFRLPIYAGFLILPFALLEDLELAWGLWLLALELSLLAVLLLSLRLTRWKPGPLLFIVVLLLATTGFYSMLALFRGTITIFVALLFVLAMLALRAERYEFGGFLLALTTLQPNVVFLAILFTIFWAISRRNWLLLAWFFGTVAILSVLGMFALPDWPLQYLRVLFRTRGQITLVTPGAAFKVWWPGLGAQMGWFLSVIMLVVLAAEWIKAWRKEFRWFFWTASLSLVVNQWAGVPTGSDHFVLLLAPLILVFSVWDERFLRTGRYLSLILAGILYFGVWFHFWRLLTEGEIAHQHWHYLFPLPVALIIGLYWVRWWAVRPYRLFVEDLRAFEEL